MTQTFISVPATKEELFSITCDKCGKESKKEHGLGTTMEWTQYLSISKLYGYWSNRDVTQGRYGDGDTIHIDLCQKCTFDVLGPYLRVENKNDY